MATNAERKETRLVARTSTEMQEIIQRAADYSGATLSQFLIESAMEKARNVIEWTETLHLSMAGADALFAALENPPKANTKLLKAAQNYKDTVDVREHWPRSMEAHAAAYTVNSICEYDIPTVK